MPPEPHRLVADVDAALVQQVFDVAERQREPDVHHHRQADNLRARLEVAERGTFCHRGRVGRSPPRLKPSCSDKACSRYRWPPPILRRSAPQDGWPTVKGCFRRRPTSPVTQSWPAPSPPPSRGATEAPERRQADRHRATRQRRGRRAGNCRPCADRGEGAPMSNDVNPMYPAPASRNLFACMVWLGTHPLVQIEPLTLRVCKQSEKVRSGAYVRDSLSRWLTAEKPSVDILAKELQPEDETSNIHETVCLKISCAAPAFCRRLASISTHSATTTIKWPVSEDF